ncbi:hypothetical protein F4780DRAFT_796069 [Xylariomycetidae sp. FL0641]|nr:hypothetical protein F4780DRAFT_796069 [Xylariomycetidae sp. FL0641]
MRYQIAEIHTRGIRLQGSQIVQRSSTEYGLLEDHEPEDFRERSNVVKVLDDGLDAALRLEVLPSEARPSQLSNFPPTIIQWLGTPDEPPYRGLAVQKYVADWARLKFWMATPKAGESPVSTASGKEEALDLRFLDLKENRVTLRPSSSRPVLEEEFGLDHHSVELPQTMRDAMKDDPDDLARNIARTGSIYVGATLNFVACTNVNPHDGLLGLGTPRSRQLRQREEFLACNPVFRVTGRPMAEFTDENKITRFTLTTSPYEMLRLQGTEDGWTSQFDTETQQHCHTHDLCWSADTSRVHENGDPHWDEGRFRTSDKKGDVAMPWPIWGWEGAYRRFCPGAPGHRDDQTGIRRSIDDDLKTVRLLRGHDILPLSIFRRPTSPARGDNYRPLHQELESSRAKKSSKKTQARPSAAMATLRVQARSSMSSPHSRSTASCPA